MTTSTFEQRRMDVAQLWRDKKTWTPDTDMTRYTDANHPDFWQPDWANDAPYFRNNGITNTKHATRNTTLPMKLVTLPLSMLAAM